MRRVSTPTTPAQSRLSCKIDYSLKPACPSVPAISKFFTGDCVPGRRTHLPLLWSEAIVHGRGLDHLGQVALLRPEAVDQRLGLAVSHACQVEKPAGG